MNLINHQFLNKEWFLPNWECATLIIGSFNPEDGEKVDYFYGRKRNKFWKCIHKIYNPNQNVSEHNNKVDIDLLKTNLIGCADLIRSIEMKEKVLPNDKQIYKDSKLILKSNHIEFNTEHIIKRLEKKDIKNVLLVLSKSIRDKRVNREIESLKQSCKLNDIQFIDTIEDTLIINKSGRKYHLQFSGYSGLSLDCTVNKFKYYLEFKK